mgnify:CR=1 FL=1
MNKLSNQKTKVSKPVYFNLNNPKEKEMIEWLDDKFTSYGGLVKDLLYQEMMREKQGLRKVEYKEVNESDEKNKECEIILTKEDVAEYDC